MAPVRWGQRPDLRRSRPESGATGACRGSVRRLDPAACRIYPGQGMSRAAVPAGLRRVGQLHTGRFASRFAEHWHRRIGECASAAPVGPCAWFRALPCARAATTCMRPGAVIRKRVPDRRLALAAPQETVRAIRFGRKRRSRQSDGRAGKRSIKISGNREIIPELREHLVFNRHCSRRRGGSRRGIGVAGAGGPPRCRDVPATRLGVLFPGG